MSDQTNSTLSQKDALDHAWSWFEVHAAQRLQSFNFFLVATAFLIAAYGAVLDRHSAIAAIIAVFGAWITFWFHRMERRTRQLVIAAEDALRPIEDHLAQISESAQIKIVENVRTAECGAFTYGTVIRAIQCTTLLVFMILAICAFSRLYELYPLFL